MLRLVGSTRRHSRPGCAARSLPARCAAPERALTTSDGVSYNSTREMEVSLTALENDMAEMRGERGVVGGKGAREEGYIKEK